jgi:hypothetical protein
MMISPFVFLLSLAISSSGTFAYALFQLPLLDFAFHPAAYGRKLNRKER